jgi:hypothetical protein
MTRAERVAERRKELAKLFVRTEANRLAKLAIKDQIKARGERVTDYSCAQLMLAAERWLQGNPQIIEQARANVQVITGVSRVIGHQRIPQGASRDRVLTPDELINS